MSKSVSEPVPGQISDKNKKAVCQYLTLNSKLQRIECPSVRVSECPSVRVSECPSVRVSECPSVRVSECPRHYITSWPRKNFLSLKYL